MPTAACERGGRTKIHFYDVAQGLSALVELPDGRHVLVDAGDSPTRRGCGTVCADASRHVIDALRTDLGGAPLDLLWCLPNTFFAPQRIELCQTEPQRYIASAFEMGEGERS